MYNISIIYPNLYPSNFTRLRLNNLLREDFIYNNKKYNNNEYYDN